MAGDGTEGMKLPLELLDTIVDELAANRLDRPDCELALLNCALVCRSFYTRASAHIFATIVFVSGNSDVNDVLARKLEDLDAILERNDSLAHIDIYGQPEDGLSPSTTSHTMPKLKSHVSHNSADLVFRLMSKSPSIFSELSALSVWMRRSDEVNAAWAIMQSAATTLETLDIEDVSHFRYPTMIPGPVDIGVMTNLRRFKVNCRIASGDGVF